MIKKIPESLTRNVLMTNLHNQNHKIIIMKRIILPVLVAFLFAFTANSQNTTFVEGDKVLNVGLGIGSTLYTGSAYGSSIPPLSASLEFNVVDELFDENSSIGVGGYLGFAAYNYTVAASDYGFSNFILGGRGALHYQFIEQLDTYAGLLLGYRIVNWNAGEFSAAASGGFISAFFIGGRYYFNDNIGAMLELGYGIAYLNIGVAIKF
jgi:hypothetical protein